MCYIGKRGFNVKQLNKHHQNNTIGGNTARDHNVFDRKSATRIGLKVKRLQLQLLMVFEHDTRHSMLFSVIQRSLDVTHVDVSTALDSSVSVVQLLVGVVVV